MTDRRTDRQTDRRTDAQGKTICLPTLKGGNIIKNQHKGLNWILEIILILIYRLHLRSVKRHRVHNCIGVENTFFGRFGPKVRVYIKGN